MIGRVGTAFGEHGVNIVSAAVGAEAGADRRRHGADHRRAGPERGRSQEIAGDATASTPGRRRSTSTAPRTRAIGSGACARS